MRGKALIGLGYGCDCRITPAHAGKRSSEQFFRGSYGDHPRTCGEKFPVVSVFCVPVGSPPHMRGKVDMLKQAADGAGITPAHAGKRKIFQRK